MDIGESVEGLGRRWYIVVAILAGFALVAIFVIVRGDPEYRASASMVIHPRSVFDGAPFLTGSTEAQNPLNYLGAETTLTSIALIFDARETRSELETAGFSPNYTVTVDTKEDPQLLIEVPDRDPVIAQATVDELVIRVQQQLDTLQATVGAPESELLEFQVTHTSPPP